MADKKRKPNRFVLDDPDAIEVVSKPKKTTKKPTSGSKK